MYSATVIATLRPYVVALIMLSAAPAAAQSDPRFAVDRFEPSERGSEWFTNESLRFHGPSFASYRVGAVSSFAERPFVIRAADGSVRRSPVRDLEVIHLGGNLVIVDFLRLSLDLPIQAYAAGRTDGAFRSPPKEQGLGDLRIGMDVRVFGRDEDHVRLALGAQVWAPIGQKDQWASDGTARIRPRVTAAGDYRLFTWSAQVNTTFRDDRLGSELGLSAAAGLRVADQIVVGPELFTSTRVDDVFGARSTPVEALVGAHWLIARRLRIGAGIGRGFSGAVGDPQYRILGSIELAPEFGPPQDPGFVPPPPRQPDPAPVIGDADHDHVPDDKDACPTVAGIPTADPSSNGCPPDTDGDQINDLGDACPTQPGPATTDPATNGCPPPRDE